MYLEVGDYLPFIKINGVNRTKEMHNFVSNKPFVIACSNNINDFINIQTDYLKLSNDFNIINVFNNDINNETNNNYKQFITNDIIYTCDEQLIKLLECSKDIITYFVSPNRRIKHISYNYADIDFNTINYKDYLEVNSHIPYLIIDNVLDPELLNEIINYYYNSKNNNTIIGHCHNTKNRYHAHPNVELEKKLDNKLSRSAFPEIQKTFYFDVTHREPYKISSYDSETRGRFHAHRDTPHPYQHRKYAMSLLLNDDYEGGEFHLPEYGVKIKPKANTAIIFPGINAHEVLEVTKGSRMAIITFFINSYDRSQYNVKSHFFKEKDIKYSKIYPN